MVEVEGEGEASVGRSMRDRRTCRYYLDIEWASVIDEEKKRVAVPQ